MNKKTATIIAFVVLGLIAYTRFGAAAFLAILVVGLFAAWLINAIQHTPKKAWAVARLVGMLIFLLAGFWAIVGLFAGGIIVFIPLAAAAIGGWMLFAKGKRMGGTFD